MTNYELKQPGKDQTLGAQLIEASSRYPRFGYRRIAVMTDTKVSRVWRLWSKLGLNLPKRRPRKRRCGSDIRIPGSTAPNGVWTYDFVHDQLANGGPLKMLCVLDENTRECLAIEVGKSPRLINQAGKRFKHGWVTTDKRKRLKALERESKALRRANEILKLASALFAQRNLTAV